MVELAGDLKCLAIIPARGGSKRIPKKNIKNFFGKPMISYAIDAALNSHLFERVVVSTDDLEISEIAISYGAEIPFFRPSNLADDYTPTVPVIGHAVQECQKLGWNFDLVCCIYPGVPFIQIDDLKGALNKFLGESSRYCFPVAKFSRSIYHALKMNEDDLVSAIFTDNENARTQDFEPSFYDAGQFYWGHKSTWLENLRIHNGGLGYEIPNWRAIDIDSLDDWHLAELIFESLNSRNTL